MKTPPFAVSPHPIPSRVATSHALAGVCRLVAILPSLATLLIGYLSGGTPTVAKLLAEGDGFLVVIAITADAIGRAVDRKQAHLLPTILCGVVLALP